MAGLFSNRKEQKAFNKFFEETGIQLTTDPKFLSKEMSKEISKETEKLFYMVREKPKKAIPLLLDFIERHPDFPSAKNHLYNAYLMTRQFDQADKLSKEILSLHPKYIFGFATKILNTHEEDQLKKYEKFLGSPRDIRTIVGYDDPIHVETYTVYEAAAGFFEAVILNDDESAKNRLSRLIELDAAEQYIQKVAEAIALSRLKTIALKMEKEKEMQISIETHPRVMLPQIDEPPVFHHKELNIFYQKSTNKFSKKIIKEILSLPRETLLKDLNLLLRDGIQRWDYFSDIDFDESSHSFLLHGLYFLGALEAEENLKHVLDLLRMGDGFTSFWFGHSYTEAFLPTLFVIGNNQLEKLKGYTLEQYSSSFDRGIVIETVAQIALHFPERRAEVIEWFSDVIQYHLDNPNLKGIIDTEFTGLIINTIIDIRGVELVSLVEKLYEKGWGNSFMNSTLESVIKDIHYEFDASKIYPLPKDIYEYYSEVYMKRRAAAAPLPDEIVKIMENFHSPAEQLILEYITAIYSAVENREIPYDSDLEENFSFGNDFEPEYTEPYKRPEPKISRNAPCPCGSGKKYKRCCINK